MGRVAFSRVALHVTQYRLHIGAVQFQGQHVAVEGFGFQSLFQFTQLHADHLRLGVATIDDAGNTFLQTTQAAARTFPHVAAGFCIQQEIIGHDMSPVSSRASRDQVCRRG